MAIIMNGISSAFNWAANILTSVTINHEQGGGSKTLTVSTPIKKALLVTCGSYYGETQAPNINNITFSNGGNISLASHVDYAGHLGLYIYEIDDVGAGTITVPDYCNSYMIWAILEIN